MKKLVILILVVFLITGCSKNLTLEEGSYYDRNNLHNGESLEWIYLKEDNLAERTTCGADAGCSLYRGTYEVSENKVKFYFNEYNDIDGWIKLEEKDQERFEYEISDNNTFINSQSVFIRDTRNYDKSLNEYDVILENENEKFDFGKLHLEFKGFKKSNGDFYNYTLAIKYDGKIINNTLFNNEKIPMINSNNMAASFKVYKIEGVFVLVSNRGAQCFPNAVLIINAAGKVLKEYSNVDIEINEKKLTIVVPATSSCMEEGIKYNFEVSDLEIKAL